MSKFSEERIQQVWDKADTISGKDPSLYRQDKFGNEMYRSSYGKQSDMGWTIDHSKPQSKGGTDHLNNLQAMNWKANIQKSDKY